MAADDLPLPVVNFLNVIGVPWPYIDEDAVSRLTDLTREFARSVDTTHRDATGVVRRIADAHRAASTEGMSSRWTTMSDAHVRDVVDGAYTLAAALDVAAGYIVAQKAEAAGVLIAMAAAMAGLDWSVAAGPAAGGSQINVDPEGVREATALLRDHAAAMRDHATRFRDAFATLDF